LKSRATNEVSGWIITTRRTDDLTRAPVPFPKHADRFHFLRAGVSPVA